MTNLDDTTLDRSFKPGTWRVSIPTLVPSGNVTKRMHFRVYMALMQRLFWEVRGADNFLEISRPRGKRYLLVIRFGAKPDKENSYFAAKPLIDILRPMKIETGIYGPKTKQPGQPWRRERIGHGLILEDDPTHLEYWVRTVKRPKTGTFHTEFILSDFPLNPDDFC